MMLQQLIVNADDLGRTESINLGIEKAYREGLVSSTSLPANPLFFNHALTVLMRNPGLDVGVHLHLNEYAPLLAEEFLVQLSKMSMYEAYYKLFFISRREEALIESEWAKQIEKILSFKIAASHLDGHNHVHVHPRLVAVLLRLAERFSLSWIRLPHERLYQWSKWQRSVGQGVLSAVCLWDDWMMGQHIRYPRRFYGISAHGRMSEAWLTTIFKDLQPGVNELMCHVGLDNDDPPYSIGFGWQDELKVYTQWTKQDIKAKYNIDIVSYREAR